MTDVGVTTVVMRRHDPRAVSGDTTLELSSRRRPGSTVGRARDVIEWIPAFAGMTGVGATTVVTRRHDPRAVIPAHAGIHCRQGARCHRMDPGLRRDDGRGGYA